jgi:hypothetical protein
MEVHQSGERFRGKANIQGWRERYPARLDFEPREIRGDGDIWIGEDAAWTPRADLPAHIRGGS